MDAARKTAFTVLLRMQKDGAYSNLTLENNAALKALPQRDRAFVSALVYGVTERLLTLDYNLSLYLKKPLQKLQPQVLCLLRLGAYQILFMEKVPASAAVNETVLLAKKVCAYAGGLVNAVLRKISAYGLCLPEENAENYLSVKFSCPQWLIDKWHAEYGEDAMRGILEQSLLPSKVTIKVNPLLTTPLQLQQRLADEGVACTPTDVEGLLCLQSLPCAVDQLASFREGLFHVQDKASCLCAKAVGAEPGDTVFDLCAAPGGKTFSIAEDMGDRGSVRAFDLYPSRVRLIEQGAKRLQLQAVSTGVHDALQKPDIGLADRVLCDVPCAGLGILRRKPEIKYKTEESLSALPQLQLSILKNGAACVRDGGRLIYSTCSLSKAENEDVCAAFLKETTSFVPVAPLPALSADVFVTLLPHRDHCDGFFIAAFEKRGTS